MEHIDIESMEDIINFRNRKENGLRAGDGLIHVKKEKNKSGTTRILLKITREYIEKADLVPGQRFKILVSDNPKSMAVTPREGTGVGWKLSPYGSTEMPAAEVYKRGLIVDCQLQFTVYQDVGIPPIGYGKKISVPDSHVTAEGKVIHLDWRFLDSGK